MFEKSFSLLRTNPALTGNVKIVIDSSYNFYLESFDANNTLRNVNYKHFNFNKDEYYKELIAYFFQKTESSTIFDVLFNNDISTMYSDFQNQYDDTYFSGATFTQDNWYSEEFEYFAPLYLKNNNIPSSFIIMRVDGPGLLNSDSDNSNFRSEIIDNWKFVSMFDLTSNSDLGYWLNLNFVSDTGFPTIPMIINHADSSLSEFNGLDINNGGWVTSYVNLNQQLSTNTPTFSMEEFFTGIWESNNILYPHILNLKFLFDDNPATPDTLQSYSINRYVGFYVDSMPITLTVSPFQGYELDKVENIQNLDAISVSQIPYLFNNQFVREIDGRLYSVDPIKKGWDDSITYWAEWQGNYYKLERIINTSETASNTNPIIGDYIYKIIANINIQWTVSTTLNSTVASLLSKVLINELSTGKNSITITYESQFNNTIAYNIIENVNTTYATLTRTIVNIPVNGTVQTLFVINVNSTQNLFTIPNYNDVDLFLITINNNYHVIKQYPIDTPNVGGKYYIQSDYGFQVDEKNITYWINSGNTTLDPEYYTDLDIENIDADAPPVFNIYMVNFTDVKDFDFNRVETDYSNFEYEIETNVTSTTEPKLYAPEWRDLSINVKYIPANASNIRRIPILDMNNRPYNLKELNGDLNPATNAPYTDVELYQTGLDGSSWAIFSGTIQGTNWYNYISRNYKVYKEYYREEGYIYSTDQINFIDFLSTSDPINIVQSVTWGADGLSEISDPKIPLSPIQASVDPNTTIDTNYIPVSSEYITTDELWEIRNGNLSDIWYKNQYVCKWGFLNSKGLHDLPYRLNYDLNIGGIYNREPNPYSGQNYPVRKYFDLEYFYRFGVDSATNYKFYSLHLKELFFNIDKYVSSSYDYFEYILKSDQLTYDGISLTNKYSNFIINGQSDAFTLFRGIKYHLSDVSQIIINQSELALTGNTIIDDIITVPNTQYDGYRFSIIFGRKLPIFNTNSGNGNSNMGIDIYLNDVFKNVLIHLYVNTNETDVIQIDDNNGNVVNAETCPIDYWYNDNIENQATNPTQWESSGFKIGGFDLNLRPRDFNLFNFISTLNNKNYDPVGNKETINFIHIYSDSSVKIMNYENTDFVINSELPEEILFKENGYVTSPINVSDITVNDTITNRIVLPDNDSDSDFTSDGYRIYSLPDINAYNNYPIGKSISASSDTRQFWQLDDSTDPSIYRYSGPYVPIFKSLNLFRPLGYLNLSNTTIIPDLPSGNWKFYDINSDSSLPNLNNFGILDEVIYSKCNINGSVLKLDPSTSKDISIYPMIDEYGYDFNPRYIFSASWEPSFYYTSRIIEVEPNTYPSFAGYTLYYDGIEDYLRIPDLDKFNLEQFIIDEVNFNNNILNDPEGERSVYSYTIKNVNNKLISNIISSNFIELKLLAYQSYTMTLSFFNATTSNTMDIWIEIINDPNDVTQTNRMLFYLGQQTITTQNNVTATINFDTNIAVAVSTTQYTSHPFSNSDSSSFNVNYNSLYNNFYNNSIGGLTSNYVYNDVVNVRINFLFNSSLNTDKVDLYPIQLSLTNVYNNFLDINFGTTSGTGTITLQNDTGIFGGYFMTNEENGYILNFPSKTKIYDTVSDIQNSLSNVSTIGNVNYSLSSQRGFQLSNYANNNGRFLRISNSNMFDFEPETWTSILDGNNISFIGQKNGDSTIFPSIQLRWFSSQIQESKTLQLTATDTSKTYISTNTQLSNIPTISQNSIDTQNTVLNNYNSNTGIPLSNITPSSTATVQVSGILSFSIIPNNGTSMNININARDVDNTPLNINDVLSLINQQINPAFIATLVDDEPTYSTIQISSTYPGSYYNFTVNNFGNNIYYLDGTLIEAIEESTISFKMTKTSLIESTKRITGKISGITIEFWIKIDGWSKTYETILYKGEDTTYDVWGAYTNYNNFTYIIGRNKNDNHLAFKTCHAKLDGSFETNILVSNSLINDGNWHHVACVVDASNRHKAIYIDSKLDAYVNNFLTMSFNFSNLSDNIKVGLFLDNLSTLIPNYVSTSLLPNNLSQKIKNNVLDTTTQYWFNSIRRFVPLNYWDKINQNNQWGVTIDVAYIKFCNNLTALDYYLNVDTNLSWDILIGTDSTQTLGSRTFKGAIDELRIWNYPRTNTQISRNYKLLLNPNSYLDPINTLVAYYRFDGEQGDTIISDLMDGHMIKNIDKWSKIVLNHTNDGNVETDVEQNIFFQFETEYFTGSDIQVNISDMTWIVSGAGINGISDERYISNPIPSTTSTSITNINKPVVNITPAMAEKFKPSNLNPNYTLDNTNIPTGTQYTSNQITTNITNTPTIQSFVQDANDNNITVPQSTTVSLPKKPSLWQQILSTIKKATELKI